MATWKQQQYNKINALQKTITEALGSTDNTITSLKQLDDIIAITETAAVTGAQNTDTLKKALNNAKNKVETTSALKEEITKISSGQKQTNMLSFPPVFTKPAYFLDKFAPYLKVDLVLMFKRAKETERRQIVINLLTDDENEMHNHLVSFKYDINPLSYEIVLTDLQNEYVDYLTAQWASMDSALNEKFVRIEYGWATEPSLRSYNEETERTYFTSEFYAVLTSMKQAFIQGLGQTVTITGTIDVTMSGTERALCPYDLFGQYPALNLCFCEFFYFCEDAQNKLKNIVDNQKYKTNNKTYAIQFVRIISSFLVFHGLLDINKRADVITAYINYSHSKTNDANFKNILEIARKLLEENTRTIVAAGTYQYALLYTEYKNLDYNFMPKLMENKEHQYYNNDTPFGFIKKQIIDENALDISIDEKTFSLLYVSFAKNSFDVYRFHPYYLYEYFLDIINKKLNTQSENEKLLYRINTIGATKEHILPNKEYLSMYGGIMPTFKNVQNQLKNITMLDYTSCLNPVLYSPTVREQFLKTIKDFEATPDSSFIGLLEQVISMIKVYYHITPSNAKFYGINEKLKNASWRPIQLNGNVFVCTKEYAEKNLQKLLLVFENHKNVLISNNSTNKDEITKTYDNKIVEIKNSIAQLQKSKIKDDIVQRIFIFEDAVSSESVFFSNDAAMQRIAGAYSYRMNGMYGNSYNYGTPTVLDINFPDIIEFNTEDSLETVWRNVGTHARIVGAESSAHGTINQSQQKEINDLFNKVTQEIKNNKSSAVQLLEKLKDYRDKLLNISPNQVGATTSKNDVAINIGNYTSNRVYSGDFSGAIEKKKQIQELRKKIMMNFDSNTIKGQLKVIGDASYNTKNETGNVFVFLKVINSDNTLSPLTGLWRIDGVVQEINQSGFFTTLNISYTIINNYPEEAASFEKMIYLSDQQNITYDK